MKSHFQVLIIGGGTAGIMTAAQLLRQKKSDSIAIIDPADKHYYQPAWTLVGAGTYDFDKTAKAMGDVIPDGATWIKDRATGFNPEQNEVTTAASGSLSYDYLVVATGLVMAPEMIDGLEEAFKAGVVSSNYVDPRKTWEQIRNFKGGNAVFTQPTTPIKCGGAPQKIAYLAADYFRKKNLLDKSNVIFATPGSVIFGVKPIRETLMKVIGRYGIHFKPHLAPIKIDVSNRQIHFKHNAPNENDCVLNEDADLGIETTSNDIIKLPFDMLHMAPPQTAPAFIKESPLSNEQGWVDVDQYSMQHKKYANVFSLGDVAALPTAKTGAAIRKQVPVVVDNISKMMEYERIGKLSYNGYSSCPLVTAYGKMVLAEFDYEGNFTPDPKLKQMLVFDSSKEHWRLWMLKKYGLPYLYWNKMLKGKNV